MPQSRDGHAAPWSQAVQAMLADSGVSLGQGLAAEEAQDRLRRDGPNELRSVPPLPAWRRLLAQFQDPLVYLLLAAVGITLTVWWLEGTAGWPVDAIVILVIVLLKVVQVDPSVERCTV